MAIVGAGPRGTGVLNRIGANATEILNGRPLTVHFVDPFPPGPGRVWRKAQSPLLRMNSRAYDVTMHGMASANAPVADFSLLEWVEAVRKGQLNADVDAALLPELDVTDPGHFATRRLQSAYLTWYFNETLNNVPRGVDVHIHAASAVDVTGGTDGPQTVWLDSGYGPLVVDAVVLTLGHLEAGPAPHERDLLDFAARHDLTYLPPGYTADLDFSGFGPGETVLVRGFGLAATDLMVLLTEERGGVFSEEGDRLVYRPSGAEPKLYVGSRRGVPHLPKPGYRLQGKPAILPRFFGPGEVSRLAAAAKPLDFRADVWPLVAKEIGWGYYHELFTGHPERVRMGFAEFAHHYAVSGTGDELSELEARAVPAVADRLDLAVADRPLGSLRFTGAAEFTDHLQEHLHEILRRRTDTAFSAELGAVNAVRSAGHMLARLVATGRMAAGSQIHDIDGWWSGFSNYFTSGPPPSRVSELIALSRAGVVSFLGPGMWVRTDERRRQFLAGGESHPTVVVASCLVEARLPVPDLTRTASPLLRALHARGEVTEETLGDGAAPTGRVLTTPTHRIVGRTGIPHPRRFALGPYTSARTPSLFVRPVGVAFGENATMAREILRTLSGVKSP
ncbi:FAD/NAD(P)-binding protein [Amycolatopsis pithecellobii]|nr:FAD/NAD(P)-binding protein [Amycolatopsis pithecellobii]